MAKTTIHKPTHKRRTQDEMSKALTVITQHQDTLHVNPDDEHVYTVEDVITELLAIRDILTRYMQAVDTAHNEATAQLKKIWQ